ncbi:MAG: helix-turn-helix domain-containing protein [Clostridia bacterium]|nr:helix-turn-helix domain-containing protein [Clostridia bacterium]
MSIGDRIMQLRKEAGLSQEAFAEKLGVSRQSVSKWESDSATPDLNKVIAICELFGVSSDYLLCGKEDSPVSETSAEPEAKIYEEVYVGEENPEEIYEEVNEAETNEEKNTKSSRNKKAKVIAVVLACCILIAAIIPISVAGYKKLRAKYDDPAVVQPSVNESAVVYPYVLVHGMGGWGEGAGINSVSPYWGASTGSLSEYLRGEGHQVYEVNVGPFSSAWDRACELYAQLTGTTVDYGAAHSKEHGHDRYGKEYTTPLYTDWGTKTPGDQLHKINLVGHSFGGTTIRLLASLLEYGSEAEQSASPDDLSPLFKGGKGEWINSITTLCSPHNGSTLYYVVDKENLIPSALGILQFAGGIVDKIEGGMIDFQLEHFGITSDSQDATSLINKSFMSGKDNAFYDLSPHGAKELNQSIKTVKSIYYFSYSYCTTEKSKISDNQIPLNSTILVLKPTATLIGSYTNTADDAPIKIDESWLPNDGLVNVVSAKYPEGESHTDYKQGIKIERGIWHVLPTRTGHHGTVIGMDGNTQETHEFYTNLITMINALPRIK